MELNSRRSYVSVRTACNRIERFITSNQIPSYEIIHVWDSHKRVLAEEIVSTIDIPAYDSSHMDGYAVKAEDIIHASQQTPAALDLRTNRVRPRQFLTLICKNKKHLELRLVDIYLKERILLCPLSRHGWITKIKYKLCQLFHEDLLYILEVAT